jgi:hypothetical protein
MAAALAASTVSITACTAATDRAADAPPSLARATELPPSDAVDAASKADGVCQFTCGDYGYWDGLCHEGWLCRAGCITYTACTTSVSDDDDVEDPSGTGSDACPSYTCDESDCGTLVELPGSSDPTSERALRDGYYIATERRYAYLRKDLTYVLRHAACRVAREFPDTAPLGISDLSQADGQTPGVDVGRPRHPTSTHRGNDMDLAYYQTDGTNDPQIICGDGTDGNGNGTVGVHNDGYFCTTDENIVDWARQAYFFAMLAAPTHVRVFGVDTTLVDDFRTHVGALEASGTIDTAQAARATHLGHGSDGGWAFHHHHTHMSYR